MVTVRGRVNGMFPTQHHYHPELFLTNEHAELLAESGEFGDPKLRSVVTFFFDDGINMPQELVIHVLHAPEIDLEG